MLLVTNLYGNILTQILRSVASIVVDNRVIILVLLDQDDQ